MRNMLKDLRPPMARNFSTRERTESVGNASAEGNPPGLGGAELAAIALIQAFGSPRAD
jgi:hypothetical protein